MENLFLEQSNCIVRWPRDRGYPQFSAATNAFVYVACAGQLIDLEEGFWCNSGFPKAEVAREFQFPGTAMKRTYQASKVRRARTHGFLVRMKTRGGRAVINARRAKGRKSLAV